MLHEDTATEAGGEQIHLDWCYDLNRPFFAEAELLAARPAYATLLATDFGELPVTLRLPSRPATETGLANFLAPPLEWPAADRDADEHWGTYSRSHALGFKGVVIKRLAFSIRAHSALLGRGELGQDVLAQQILCHIDDWWDNVRTWLEIATNQRLTQVGHEQPNELNPHTRTWIWAVDEDRRHQLHVGATVTIGPDPTLGTTADILQGCVALATTKPPLAWTLLRDARALRNADQLRRAVIDTATAAELALTERLDELSAGEADPRQRKKINGLTAKIKALEKRGEKLPPSLQDDLVRLRNDAVHEGVDVQYPQWQRAFRATLELVERVYPLPTAPGSAEQLKCHWPLST